jgi:hypothetical protein
MNQTRNIMLEEKTRNWIQSRHTESFNNFCKLFGISPENHQKYLLEGAKSELLHFYKQIGRANNSNVNDLIGEDPLLAAKSWFEFKETQSNIELDGIVSRIVELSDSLPIEHSYLSNISYGYGAPNYREGDKQSLLRLLRKVPHVSLYGLDFNAFVDNTIENNIPFVGIYEQLITLSKLFIDLVIPIAMSDDGRGKIAPTTTSECLRRGSSTKFMESLKSCLDAARGNVPFAVYNEDILLSQSNPNMHLSFSFMVTGGLDWVRFHEYGHLLRGHLQQRQSHQLEYEADEFGFILIASESSQLLGIDGKKDILWLYVVGCFLVLLLLACMESIDDEKPSPTHPLAKQRIIKLLTLVDKASALTLLDIIRSVNNACNPTLKKYWGVELSLSS